jgi:hypothetical protein
MNNTKTYNVLFDGKSNENANSAKSPVCEYVPGSVNLDETVVQCVSWDNDMLVQATRYEVRPVTLPEWLSLEEWLRSNISWSYLWADARTMELPENFQRALLNFSGGLREAMVALLSTKNFRSNFRKSLRDQLVNWIETPVEDRQYNMPFSRRQIESLVSQREEWTAKNRSNRLYYAHRYQEAAGLPVAA